MASPALGLPSVPECGASHRPTPPPRPTPAAAAAHCFQWAKRDGTSGPPDLRAPTTEQEPWAVSPGSHPVLPGSPRPLSVMEGLRHARLASSGSAAGSCRLHPSREGSFQRAARDPVMGGSGRGPAGSRPGALFGPPLAPNLSFLPAPAPPPQHTLARTYMALPSGDSGPARWPPIADHSKSVTGKQLAPCRCKDDAGPFPRTRRACS